MTTSELRVPTALGELTGQCEWGSGPRVLAVHGWLDNSNSFLPLMQHFSGYRWLSIDLPGHGRSPHRPPGAVYHFVDWIFDIADILVELQWDAVHLVGHSMGAAIAAAFAGVAPESVKSLVLLDGLGPEVATPSEIPARMTASLHERRRLGRHQLPVYPDRAAMAARLAQAVPGLSQRAALCLVERGSRRHGEGYTWTADARLRNTSSVRFVEPVVTAWLSQIRCPTLFVRPDHGYRFDEERMQRWIAAIPHLRVQIVPGAHHAHMDQPDVVAAAIQTFWHAVGAT